MILLNDTLLINFIQLGLILSGGVDKTINVYEPESTEPLYVLIGHDNTVSSISSTPDGSIISGSWDK